MGYSIKTSFVTMNHKRNVKVMQYNMQPTGSLYSSWLGMCSIIQDLNVATRVQNIEFLMTKNTSWHLAGHLQVGMGKKWWAFAEGGSLTEATISQLELWFLQKNFPRDLYNRETKFQLNTKCPQQECNMEKPLHSLALSQKSLKEKT